jgi:hypothetical protein
MDDFRKVIAIIEDKMKEIKMSEKLTPEKDQNT